MEPQEADQKLVLLVTSESGSYGGLRYLISVVISPVQSGDRNIFYLIGTYPVPAHVPSITSTRPDEPPLTVPEAARHKASTHHPPLAQVPSIASTRPDEPPHRVPEAARHKASTRHSPESPLAPSAT